MYLLVAKSSLLDPFLSTGCSPGSKQETNQERKQERKQELKRDTLNGTNVHVAQGVIQCWFSDCIVSRTLFYSAFNVLKIAKHSKSKLNNGLKKSPVSSPSRSTISRRPHLWIRWAADSLVEHFKFFGENFGEKCFEFYNKFSPENFFTEKLEMFNQ
ncbi:hypothetical protein DFH09DRAFT_1086581 [Mycena vulgaris]|nr:hypothetical protein DFH09DRAFT_1086581 [Mycena vulgaris]